MKKARSLLYFNLVKLLDQNQISNNDLAEKINLSPATLSQKMTGNTDWKITEMLQVQEFLSTLTKEKLSLDYLFEKE